MDVKKIMGAVGALVCVINFFAASPASAERSVEWQENWSQKIKRDENLKPSNSAEATRLSPILIGIQKRLYGPNRIELTYQKFRNDSDYKTKMHPIQMVEEDNSCAIGFGDIYIGVQYVHICEAEHFRNQYDFMVAEKLIAHESTHNLRGHTFYKNSKNDNELEAEQGAVKLVEKLPEGGWGVYLVGVRRRLNRAEQNYNVMDSFEREANKRIRIDRADKVYYRGSDGKEYLIMSEGYFLNNGCDDNAYFGGQVAYCIAKGAFRPENIQIAPNNLRDIKFKGDYLLVCRSPKLPNGYRVLTELYGDHNTLQNYLNGIKVQVQNEYPLPVFYDDVSQTISTYRSKYPIEKAYCQIWMACAIAQDNANR